MSDGPRWDVFVSYASEDRMDIAVPLAAALTQLGLRVWIDIDHLEVGDSIRRSIDAAIHRSRFAVVILSPASLSKIWPANELSAFFARENFGEQSLLPVWHNVSKEDVVRLAPLVADRLAVATSEGIEAIAQRIAGAVIARGPKVQATPTLTQCLVEALGKHPRDIAELLVKHSALVRALAGFHGDVSTPPRIQVADSGSPVTLELPPMVGSFHIYPLLVLCSPVARIQVGRRRPHPELAAAIEIGNRYRDGLIGSPTSGIGRWLENWANRLFGKSRGSSFFVVPVTVLIGRRAALSTQDKRYLSRLRERNRANVRTYDYLLGATLAEDRRAETAEGPGASHALAAEDSVDR